MTEHLLRLRSITTAAPVLRSMQLVVANTHTASIVHSTGQHKKTQCAAPDRVASEPSQTQLCRKATRLPVDLRTDRQETPVGCRM